MPAIIHHLYVALKYAERHPELLDIPEYWLGQIAPDAVLSRPDGAALHAVTHLRRDGIPWERSVLDSLRVHAPLSPYLLGCHQHVVVDALFYGRFDTDGNNTGAYGEVMDILDRMLLARMPEFPDIVARMEQAQATDDYPGTTAGDLAAAVGGCRALAARMPAPEEILPDPDGYPLGKLLAQTDRLVEALEALTRPDPD